MSIFSKISKALGGKGPTPEAEQLLSELSRDNRVHARYILQGDGVAHITLESGLTGLVRDVSYGGMAVRFQTGGVTPALAKEVTGKMRVLDREVPTKFCPVRIVSQSAESLYIGCTFVHDTAETLVFLRDVIEPLRCGKTLTLLPDDMRNEKYRGAEWSCFRGDGPTDLLVRAKKETGELEEALLTFRVADAYREVSFLKGCLQTGKSTNRGNEGSAVIAGSQMVSTSELDKVVLRHAAFCMVGAPPQYRKMVEPLLRLVLSGLDVSLTDEKVA